MKAENRIYVASAVEQLVLVDHYVSRLKEAFFDVTYEWTADVRENGFKPDVDLSPTVRRFVAKMDSRGVSEANIVWVLTPAHKHQGCGMWVELGMALAQKKRVVLSGPLCRRTVFSELAEACFEEHEDAFSYLRSKAAAA